jgi:hypothetical protein
MQEAALKGGATKSATDYEAGALFYAWERGESKMPP